MVCVNTTRVTDEGPTPELGLRVRKERVRYNASKQLFAFSILYLFLLFAMLLVERMSGGLFGHFAA